MYLLNIEFGAFISFLKLLILNKYKIFKPPYTLAENQTREVLVPEFG